MLLKRCFLGRPLGAALAAYFFVVFCPVSALAVRPEPYHYSDAKRFGLDKPQKAQAAKGAREVVARFNALRRGATTIGLTPAGALAPVLHGAAPSAAPQDVAQAFLQQNRDWLGLDPQDLRLASANQSRGIQHLLFSQGYQGVPIEFSRIKLHLSQQGEILSVQSNLRPGLSLNTTPRVSQIQAAQAVAAEIRTAPASGQLVFFPLWDTGELRLAWKFESRARGGWVYYVDANTGQVLFRYNNLRFACATQGYVNGQVFDLDPSSPSVSRPMPHESVHVYLNRASVQTGVRAVTDTTGFYCSATSGKIYASLQGPFAAVANFKGPSAHYDNGSGLWNTFSSPVSSPHPYPPNSVIYSTVTAPSNALKVLPIFSSFDVGSVDASNDIIDDDQVAIMGPLGHFTATYIGNRPPFYGAAVNAVDFGLPTPNLLNMRLVLNAFSGASHTGYDVNVSSYLYFPLAAPADVCGTTTPDVPCPITSTFTWTNAMTFDRTQDEMNLFYHVNLMHDYFKNGVDSGDPSPSTGAFIDQPLVVMSGVTGLANAFFDPVQSYLAFGDVNDAFPLDATVVHHEYTHFVVDQIYPVINFGQYGALSEALADYFSASSLNDSTIGKFTASSFGSEGGLRELNCPTNAPCKVFPNDWVGEIHQDSVMVSQALWQLRTNLIANLGAPAGQSCADGLVFQSLFFFPDSFQEFEEAVIQVDALSQSLVPACGANNSQNGLILSAFSNHGITANPTDLDPYEPNDGIQTATDITTAPVIAARIFPAADIDVYSVPAGQGGVEFTLNLPANNTVPGAYFAYGLTLVDRDLRVLATAEPPIDINPTLGGACPDTNCMTSAPKVVLDYPSGFSAPLYLIVAAAPGANGSNSATSSTAFYTLTAQFNRAGPVGAGILGASFDNDSISFNVAVSSFARVQPMAFHHAHLLDHSLAILPQTETTDPTSYLTVVSTASGGGQLSGVLRIRSGFNSRFAAIGTVHLEIFAVDPLGSVQSLGLSPEFNLTTNQANLSAWNNVFDPLRGQKATFKYEILSPGNVSLKLYTMSGVLVTTLLNDYKPAGKGSVDWYGTNALGNRVASGIYLLHLEGPGIQQTQKVIVVK